jgi:hypothetical protein
MVATSRSSSRAETASTTPTPWHPWSHWVETRLAALSDAAQLVSSMPPTVWRREIVRLSRRLEAPTPRVLLATDNPEIGRRVRAGR